MPKAPDRSKLSHDPTQIRRRLRRGSVKIEADLEELGKVDERYARPVTEWDLEELARGRPRSRRGDFSGTSPKWITPSITREAKRRLIDTASGALAAHLDLAVDVIAKLLKDKSVDDNGRPIVDARTKLAAAQFIVEHVKGKAPQKMEIEGDDLVRQALVGAIMRPNGLPMHPSHAEVIEGMIVDDDEEEDDDDDDA